MKLTVKMKCWDGDKSWVETNTFEGPTYYDIDDQIYNHLDWCNGFVVEDYEVLEAAE